MGVWECGGMGEKTKIEDRGSKIEWVSLRLAILDHPSSILKPSPTRPYLGKGHLFFWNGLKGLSQPSRPPFCRKLERASVKSTRTPCSSEVQRRLLLRSSMTPPAPPPRISLRR